MARASFEKRPGLRPSGAILWEIILMSLGNEIVIRELTVNDVNGFINLKNIGLRSDPKSFLADLSDDNEDYKNEVTKRIEKSSIENGDIVLGAFIKDDLIGISSITRSRNRKRLHKADLHGMYIKPEYRGIGLGKKLLERILEMSRKMNGLEEIQLIVAAHNDPVKRLYEKYGFTVMMKEEHALKMGNEYVDAYHMKLGL